MSKLLDIQPKELKFTIELKKPSSCSVRLANNTNNHVAYKVKTTSPKRYCVRPNVGVVMPNSSCDFIVTMQMPRTTPIDLDCKDKFLIQSTVVSAETTDEDITASMFVKDSGKLVEEKKLRVTLINPLHSPTLSPMNGDLNQEIDHDYLFINNQSLNGVEKLSKQHKVSKDTEESGTVKINEPKSVEATELKPVRNVEFMLKKDVQELKPAKGVEELKPAKHTQELKPAKHMEELKPVNFTEELKPVKYAEELKPSVYTEELKPSVYTEELKPSMYVEELKSAKYVEELKPSLYAEELKPPKYVEEVKPKYVEEVKPLKYVEELKPSKYVEEVKPAKDAKDLNSHKDVEALRPAKDVGLKYVGSVDELKPVRDVEMKIVKAEEELKLFKDVEEIKSKLSQFEVKLHQADVTILKLMEERKSNIEERKFLQEKLEELSKRGVKTVQVGFPLLFVFMVAFISIVLGYRLHP